MKIKLTRAFNGNYLIQDQLGNDLEDFEALFSFNAVMGSSSSTYLIIHTAAWVELSNEVKVFLDQRQALNVLLIGKKPEQLVLGRGIIHMSSTKSFIESGIFDAHQQTSFLLKSHGSQHFDQLAKTLSHRSHETELVVDLNRITRNTDAFRQQLSPQTKLMVMVKADAYGAGSIEVAKWLTHLHVDYFGVAFIDEGIALRKGKITKPIMVMSPGRMDASLLMQHDLEPEVYTLDQLKAYDEALNEGKKRLHLHLMLNTGMNRLGFDANDLEALTTIISGNNNLVVKGIQTHLAAAEDPNQNDFTKAQVDRFNHMVNFIKEKLCIEPMTHILNSAGISKHGEFQNDMVRLGIGIHGVSVDEGTSLQFSSTLKTTIVQIRTVERGETIGYGRTGKAEQDLKIATIPIGYADGYIRDFGKGTAYVSINGKRAKTIGNICMDLCMIDVTGIDCKINDEVILFGDDPTIEMLAKWSQSIPYEILTTIGSRVQRVYCL
jgi:alanine racemase